MKKVPYGHDRPSRRTAASCRPQRARPPRADPPATRAACKSRRMSPSLPEGDGADRGHRPPRAEIVARQQLAVDADDETAVVADRGRLAAVGTDPSGLIPVVAVQPGPGDLHEGEGDAVEQLAGVDVHPADRVA